MAVHRVDRSRPYWPSRTRGDLAENPSLKLTNAGCSRPLSGKEHTTGYGSEIGERFRISFRFRFRLGTKEGFAGNLHAVRFRASFRWQFRCGVRECRENRRDRRSAPVILARGETWRTVGPLHSAVATEG